MSHHETSDLQRKIILESQSGMQPTPTLYQDLAAKMGISENDLLTELKNMSLSGLLRRVAVVPNHYKLGFVYNGMTVWNVDAKDVSRVGTILGELEEVSHCYERPRHEPLWNYNIFAMIHGRDKEAVLDLYSSMKTKLAGLYLETDILFSSKILKKTGLRIPSERPNV